jgi:prepilin-type N-terminal cleavage/methylation domain-containing protein
VRISVFPTKPQSGFTLIELLVALLVGMITMSAVITFFSVQATTLRLENARRAAQMTARGAVNFIVRNLEQIGRNPRQTLFTAANPAIQTAGDESLSYQTNLSDEWTDVDVSDAWENVTFSFVDKVVLIAQGGGDPIALTDWTTQRSYVPAGGLVFIYYDTDGNEVAPGGDATARTSIRRINVSLTVRGVVPDGYQEPEVTLSQDVFLRNVSY